MDRRTTAKLRREQGHLNATEVASLIGVNKFTMYYWIEHGFIPKPTITFTGRRRYYSARDVARIQEEFKDERNYHNVIEFEPRSFSQDFRPHRKYFQPSHMARRDGYFPKSYWENHGRVVIDQDTPVLAVAHHWKTSSVKDSEIILSWNDWNEYIVTDLKYDSKRGSRNAWTVYEEAETKEKESKRRKRRDDAESYLILPNNEDRQQDSEPHIAKKKGRKRGHSVITPYVILLNNKANNVPEQGTGVWLTVPKELEAPVGLANEVNYYCHTILQGFFNKKHDWDKTVRIKRKLMQKILGGASKETRARQWLLENGIIYTDHIYIKGNFPKSYGLNPRFSRQVTRWEVENSILANRIRLSRIQRTDLHHEQKTRQPDILDYLEEWANSITIDLDACRLEVDEEQRYNLGPADSIAHQDYTLTRDDYGRVHSPFTQLWKPLRQHLRFEGQSLVEVDIRNSQIVFLVKMLKEQLLVDGGEPNSGQAQFAALTEEGEIYDHLLAKARIAIPDYLGRKKVRQQQIAIWQRVPIKSIDVASSEVVRDDFKRMLFVDVFYGSPQAVTPLTELFRAEFPSVHQFIDQQKLSCYKDLPRNMQRAESSLMIDTACLRLMNHHSEIPVVTIHDSILTTPEYLPTVSRIIAEEFARMGLSPTLK